MKDKKSKQAFSAISPSVPHSVFICCSNSNWHFFFLMDQRGHRLWMFTALGGGQGKVLLHVRWMSKGFVLKQALGGGLSFPAISLCCSGSVQSICAFMYHVSSSSFRLKHQKSNLYLGWYWEKWEKWQLCLQTQTYWGFLQIWSSQCFLVIKVSSKMPD